MQSLTGLFDQLNPYNTGNMVLFFAWVSIFAFTMVGVWRCQTGWLRFCCFLVNQLFSVGVVVSLTVTALLAYTYWWQSIFAAVASGAAAWLVFRSD